MGPLVCLGPAQGSRRTVLARESPLPVVLELCHRCLLVLVSHRVAGGGWGVAGAGAVDKSHSMAPAWDPPHLRPPDVQLNEATTCAVKQ